MVSEPTFCKKCNAMIVFVTTPKGKQMPCDSARSEYVPDARGRQVFVNERGEVLHGWAVGGRGKNTELGYRPHFASCPYAVEYAYSGKPPGAGAKTGGAAGRAAGDDKNCKTVGAMPGNVNSGAGNVTDKQGLGDGRPDGSIGRGSASGRGASRAVGGGRAAAHRRPDGRGGAPAPLETAPWEAVSGEQLTLFPPPRARLKEMYL